jgi:CRISPR-associated protein Cmr3
MSTRVGLCLEPLDVLFFRDGRPFAAASKVVSGLPTPQVLAGAVRTALLEKYGCDFARLKPAMKDLGAFAPAVAAAFPDCAWIGGVRFRGPWLCRLPDPGRKIDLDVFLPVPATLQTPKKGENKPGVPDVLRLKPLKEGGLPGWAGPGRPLWLERTAGTREYVATEPASGFLDSLDRAEEVAGGRPGETTVRASGLKTFLAGGVPEEKRIHKAGEFYDFDTRTGIGINPDALTAGDGEIYGIQFLAMKRACGRQEDSFGFYAEVDLPDAAPTDALTGVGFLAFGGEGKRVAVREVEPFEFPAYAPQAGKKSFLLLTTPSVTTAGGQPYVPEGCVAAAVNSPVAISGWDLAKGGPKPTRFASPAGSVYFLDTPDPVPEQPDEFGYGCHLQGVWTDDA